MNRYKIDRRLVYLTYIQMIKNSLNSNMFKTSYGLINNKKTNLTQDGVLSCAYFVSSVLKIHGFIQGVHLTVTGTEKDLINFGWSEISKPKKGSVLVWKIRKHHNGSNRHIGFYINKNMVISNNSKSKNIKREKFKREIIEKIYYLPNIEKL